MAVLVFSGKCQSNCTELDGSTVPTKARVTLQKTVVTTKIGHGLN